MYKSFLKPVLDRLLAAILLFLCLPLFLIISSALALELKGSPFFRQARPGKNGKIFHIIKFKSMNEKKNKQGELLPDIERLTKLGAIVRKFSLDEIPQLINVMLGQMSFIGPRPLLVEYLDIYTKNEKRRHNVLPGITGWAQVNGRNAISWKQKFSYDLEYVDNISLRFDIRIVLQTLVKVLKRDGVNVSATQTMEKYNGRN